jgi:type III restriction enzyme
MPTLLNTGTRDIPLQFAKQLSATVNAEWEQGSFMSKVSPITQDLLRYWFSPAFCEERQINFHEGQRQAILNTIYCHEILKTTSVFDMYQRASKGIMDAHFLDVINKEKFSHPKYCIKMATGTGKTWVMNALFLWQYLNAKYNDSRDTCMYTKNFLFIAPGLIVYERLLDSFLGKENENGIRHFTTSDLKQNEQVFIPEKYREAVYSFVQTNVVKKDEIGKKITGEGIIAITNWHLLMGEDENKENGIASPLEDSSSIIKDLLPITPGTTSGHALDTLDNQFLNSGGELAYLRSLKNVCVFNDEAHHIHENKMAGIVSEVEWQRALNYIADGKSGTFMQVDFSATPYDITGSGQRRTKHYFPHIVVDYSLSQAVHSGLVKTIAIDRRKEFASLADEDLDFKAERDGKNVIGLSEGQRLMLRAGLSRLQLLEGEFVKINPQKHPKMLVICEDTKVSPFVREFMLQEGLAEEDVLQIDSDKKGAVKPEEWKQIKQSLFNIDKKETPKVVISVLMLREGFDVSNVCVIVPLRSSQAPILLEQVIGRGLRLMWREHDYDDIKTENRHKMLDLKEAPNGYYDILHIVEHPAFIQFYEDLDNDMFFEEIKKPSLGSVLGDMITVKLKADYQHYDFYIPSIIRDREEILTPKDLQIDGFEEFGWSLEQLQSMVARQSGEIFIAQEMIVKTRFGEYKVHSDIFNAQSYNDFLAKLMKAITENIGRLSSHSNKNFPTLQINQVPIVSVIDNYIRNRLFKKPFDPLIGNNWRVLMLAKVGIVQHIMKQVSKAIYELQNNVSVEDAEISKRYFSEITSLKMRQNFALDIRKSIYEKTAYPSNKGEFEKDFMLFADTDSEVERLIKINENYHLFASLKYIRTDGMLSSYYPDFMLKIGDDVYMVETKAQKDVSQENVIQKQKGALDWIKKTNELPEEDRMNATWHYAILGDNTFRMMKDRNASVRDMLEYCQLTQNRITNTLL